MSTKFYRNDETKALEDYVGRAVSDVYFMEAEGVMYLAFEFGDRVVGLEVGAGRMITALLENDTPDYTVH